MSIYVQYLYHGEKTHLQTWVDGRKDGQKTVSASHRETAPDTWNNQKKKLNIRNVSFK